MNILISGGSGFYWHKALRFVSLQEMWILSKCNIIINLAGEPLNKHRWNDKVKKIFMKAV